MKRAAGVVYIASGLLAEFGPLLASAVSSQGETPRISVILLIQRLLYHFGPILLILTGVVSVVKGVRRSVLCLITGAVILTVLALWGVPIIGWRRVGLAVALDAVFLLLASLLVVSIQRRRVLAVLGSIASAPSALLWALSLWLRAGHQGAHALTWKEMSLVLVSVGVVVSFICALAVREPDEAPVSPQELTARGVAEGVIPRREKSRTWLRWTAGVVYIASGLICELQPLLSSGIALDRVTPSFTLGFVIHGFQWHFGSMLLILSGVAVAIEGVRRSVLCWITGAAAVAGLAIWTIPVAGWRNASWWVLTPAAVFFVLAGLTVLLIKRRWLLALLGSLVSAPSALSSATTFLFIGAYINWAPTPLTVISLVFPLFAVIASFICALSIRVD